jgi:Uma2 family endonuclease
MAAGPQLITLQEFLDEYGAEDGYEYWFGEVVRKGMVTWKHALLARVLANILEQHGYKTGGEIDLVIDPNWRPRPDVLAAHRIEHPYPTSPQSAEIVIEVLSPDDRMNRVFRKCRHYVRVGIPQIFVFDPESKDAWEWSRTTNNLERIETMQLGAITIAIDTVWKEFDARLQQ